MGFFGVNFDDLDRIGSRFRLVQASVPRSGYGVADDIGRIAADAIREEAPERSGALKRSVQHAVRVVGRIGGGLSVRVVANRPYAGWVIEGRGVVRPVRARCLHWMTESGEDVFAMRAGPTKPNPFHERGWKRAYPSVRQRWNEYAVQVGKQLAN